MTGTVVRVGNMVHVNWDIAPNAKGDPTGPETIQPL